MYFAPQDTPSNRAVNAKISSMHNNTKARVPGTYGARCAGIRRAGRIRASIVAVMAITARGGPSRSMMLYGGDKLYPRLIYCASGRRGPLFKNPAGLSTDRNGENSYTPDP